jgi:hypothetical protein
MITGIFIAACLLFALACIKYGKFLSSLFELNDKNHASSQTPYLLSYKIVT